MCRAPSILAAGYCVHPETQRHIAKYQRYKYHVLSYQFPRAAVAKCHKLSG